MIVRIHDGQPEIVADLSVQPNWLEKDDQKPDYIRNVPDSLRDGLVKAEIKIDPTSKQNLTLSDSGLKFEMKTVTLTELKTGSCTPGLYHIKREK